MKELLIAVSVLFSMSVNAQKFFTKTGKTDFKASVEAFEAVEAASNSTTAILNTATGDIAALIFINSFHFEVALMEEHFNENYMDTKTHPKAKFTGKIVGFDAAKLTDEWLELTMTGTLTVRGVEKTINDKIKLKKIGAKIIVSGFIIVTPSDFKIDIPGAVSSKIAKEIKVTMNYELVEKK
jgi:polyisoprenoid-binding protein YceI